MAKAATPDPWAVGTSATYVYDSNVQTQIIRAPGGAGVGAQPPRAFHATFALHVDADGTPWRSGTVIVRDGDLSGKTAKASFSNNGAFNVHEIWNKHPGPGDLAGQFGLTPIELLAQAGTSIDFATKHDAVMTIGDPQPAVAAYGVSLHYSGRTTRDNRPTVLYTYHYAMNGGVLTMNGMRSTTAEGTAEYDLATHRLLALTSLIAARTSMPQMETEDRYTVRLADAGPGGLP